MAEWDISSAIASLRSLLGDNLRDKFEFKADVFPTPDAVTTRFFVGQTRINSLEVYHNGVDVTAQTSSLDELRGSFSYAPSGTAPSGMLQASYYYQWFDDGTLVEFLNEAAQMLQFQSVSGDGIVVGLRPTLMSWACYNAYMRKAAEFAESITAAAGGYTFSRENVAPNWQALAKIALEQGTAKLKLYVENPINAKNPAIAFVKYCLARYQPP